MRAFVLLMAAALAFGADQTLTPDMQAVIQRITPDSLRGNLSFLSSDLLEGRGTPSRGLDLAAEFIAARFRAAGLEPAGDDGYFQNATLTVREQNPSGFEMTVTAGGRTVKVQPSETSILTDKTISLENVPVIAVEKEISAEQASGKVILWTAAGRRPNVPSTAALVLFPSGNAQPMVFDPEAGARRGSFNTITSADAIALVKSEREARVTLHVEPAMEHPAKVHNVAGILRGSDPALKDTYVMLTAHYDHLGTRATGEDRIFNGANDDGSGTVSVMEIASALASLNPHPKRSVLFVTFFGEELGLVGSRYYGRHPLEPLAKTIADLNLEQIGRTDDTEGPQVGTATLTGFDFSGLTKVLIEAGKLTGIKVYKNAQASDAYFSRSDNQAMADVGVPAHTLCVAFDYPDYHAVGDEWPKVDYANMAKVDRMVAVGLMRLASDEAPPKWSEENAGARKYSEAAKKLK
jgi:Peptidase family M28